MAAERHGGECAMSGAYGKQSGQHPVLRRLAYAIMFLAGTLSGFWMFSEGEYRYRVAQFDLERIQASIGDEQRMDQSTYAARYQEYSAKLPALLRQLPEVWPRQDIAQEIQALAKNHGMASPAPKIGDEQRHEFWGTRQYTLEMRGGADQLVAFVADLTRADAPLRKLEGLSMHADDEPGMQVATIQVTYYRWLTQEEFSAQSKPD
jgi:Tfp pilus assembly protein PilO